MAINRTSGKKPSPIRAFLYGKEKVGKSTFALDLPEPAHLDLGRETYHLDVPDRWDIQSWGDLLEAIEHLEKSKHDRKSLVIDTLDRLEEYLHEFICQRDERPSIESYGYGKGYKEALTEARRLWARIEAIRMKRGMHVLVIGHSQVKNFKNPLGDDFDQFIPKCHEQLVGFVKDQVDAIMFVTMEQVLGKLDKEHKTKKLKYTGARVLHLQQSAAFEAGCRYPVPARVEFSWEQFERAYRDGEAINPDDIILEIELALEGVENGDFCKLVRDECEKSKEDTLRLSRILDRVNMKKMGA